VPEWLASWKGLHAQHRAGSTRHRGWLKKGIHEEMITLSRRRLLHQLLLQHLHVMNGKRTSYTLCTPYMPLLCAEL
jgi:hypothetical protein